MATKIIESNKRDKWGRDWIVSKANEILQEYIGTPITVRQLYYRLVTIGLPNGVRFYKRVVDATSDARWSGKMKKSSFIDRERGLVGETDWEEKDLDAEIAQGFNQVKAWMSAYSLNRWSNQPKYIEVWIEKKALQGVFERPCSRRNVGLAPCKGYPSITFLAEAADRLRRPNMRSKEVIILYFGDYDPSGEDIPRNVQESLGRLGASVEVKRLALLPAQIEELGLPGVPPKDTDSRTNSWTGEEAVELDAIDPKLLATMCEEAIDAEFDEDLYGELEEREEKERVKYAKAVKAKVAKLDLSDLTGPDEDDEDEDDDDAEEGA